MNGITQYIDPRDDADYRIGFDDAMAGRKSCSKKARSITCYSTGYSEGSEMRERKIHEARVTQGKKLARLAREKNCHQ